MEVDTKYLLKPELIFQLFTRQLDTQGVVIVLTARLKKAYPALIGILKAMTPLQRKKSSLKA